MRVRAWTAALAAVALTLAVPAPASATPAPATVTASVSASAAAKDPSAAELKAARARILTEVNRARAAQGLPALVAHAGLQTVSQKCSRVQSAAKKMQHCAKWSTYPAGWRAAGENVAYGFAYADVTAAWLKSPGHRANILNTAFTDIGIGMAYDASGRAYYTQSFAQYPKLAASTPVVSGRAKVGAVLTAAPGAWTGGATLTYRWSANGTTIAGATARTFRPTAAQAGAKITVTVTGTKSGYSAVTRTSRATAAVAR